MDGDGPAVDGELALRRAALEEEYQAKARDLKLQHKRIADRLDEDRRDWEAHRRAQQSELAQRVEKIRRQEENHQRDLAALHQAQKELQAAKEELERQRVLRHEVRQAAEVQSASEDKVRRARSLLAASSLVALVGLGGTALLLALGETTVALGFCVTGALVAAGLEVRRRNLRAH